MDRFDALILAVLAVLDLAFLWRLRWRRGRADRVERRIVRSLRAAIQSRPQV